MHHEGITRNGRHKPGCIQPYHCGRLRVALLSSPRSTDDGQREQSGARPRPDDRNVRLVPARHEVRRLVSVYPRRWRTTRAADEVGCLPRHGLAPGDKPGRRVSPVVEKGTHMWHGVLCLFVLLCFVVSTARASLAAFFCSRRRCATLVFAGPLGVTGWSVCPSSSARSPLRVHVRRQLLLPLTAPTAGFTSLQAGEKSLKLAFITSFPTCQQTD